MKNDDIELFDICLGYSCNFRCSYCFQQYSDIQYKFNTMDNHTISKICEYIKYLITKKNKKLLVVFYGGETLIFLDKIKVFIDKLKDVEQIVQFAIATNGSLILKRKDKLLDIKKTLNSTRENKRFFTMVSYDYCLQNNRKKDTYQLIRDGITWLYNNDFFVITNSVFSINNDLNHYYDVIKDFIKLKMHCPDMYMKFNFNINYKEIDNYDNFIKNLIKTRHLLKKLNWLGNNIIRYNNTCGYISKRNTDCFWGHLYEGVDTKGDIYPSFNVIFEGNTVSKLLHIANINDNFDDIIKKHDELLSKINFSIPEKCITCKCNTFCRVYPWTQIKESLSEWNNIPVQPHCLIREMLYDNFYMEDNL